MAKKRPTAAAITKALAEKETLTRREYSSIPTADFLSTGSTVLNLACSNRSLGGIPKGTIVHYVGDSDSGKTMIALTAYAEAARNKAFDDHELVFWNAEDGSLMDLADRFGRDVERRLVEETPESLEDFWYSIDDRFKGRRPFVGVVDSMDALFPKAWYSKFQKQKNAAAKGNEASGDMGMQKAKINSEHLRKARSSCRRDGSILIIVSQTRDNANTMGYGDKQSVAGGRSLKYYSAIQLWTKTFKTIQKTVRGKPRAVGIISQIDVKKNHITGNKRRVYVPILNEMGVDDIGSCIDFLVAENHWKSTGKEGAGKISAAEFSDEKLSRNQLIEIIEESDGERDLRKLVKSVWSDIEDACKTGRKARYE